MADHSAPKPGPTPAPQGATPEKIERGVDNLLNTTAANVAEEADLLEQAHEILHAALQDRAAQ